MNKIVLILSTVLLISACSQDKSNSSNRIINNEMINLPNHLKDCKISVVVVPSRQGFNKFLYITRCPYSNTSTTYSSGKNQTTSSSVN